MPLDLPRLREHLQQTPMRQEPGQPATDLPRAAVLVAIDLSCSDPSVILTRRAPHLRLHSAEVAFPGGRCDEEDNDEWHTALREAHEEVALEPDLIEPLGTMQPVVTRTGIHVVPCVGLLHSDVTLSPNPEELDRVFRAPLAFFSNRNAVQFDEFDYAGAQRRVPRYEYREYSVWGITAAILVRLVNNACAAGIELEEYWRGSLR